MNKESMDSVRAEMKAIRLAYRKSRAEMSLYLNVSESSLEKYEQGYRENSPIPEDILIQFAKLTGVVPACLSSADIVIKKAEGKEQKRQFQRTEEALFDTMFCGFMKEDRLRSILCHVKEIIFPAKDDKKTYQSYLDYRREKRVKPRKDSELVAFLEERIREAFPLDHALPFDPLTGLSLFWSLGFPLFLHRSSEESLRMGENNLMALYRAKDTFVSALACRLKKILSKAEGIYCYSFPFRL